MDYLTREDLEYLLRGDWEEKDDQEKSVNDRDKNSTSNSSNDEGEEDQEDEEEGEWVYYDDIGEMVFIKKDKEGDKNKIEKLVLKNMPDDTIWEVLKHMRMRDAKNLLLTNKSYSNLYKVFGYKSLRDMLVAIKIEQEKMIKHYRIEQYNQKQLSFGGSEISGSIPIEYENLSKSRDVFDDKNPIILKLDITGYVKHVGSKIDLISKYIFISPKGYFISDSDVKSKQIPEKFPSVISKLIVKIPYLQFGDITWNGCSNINIILNIDNSEERIITI